MKIKRVWPIIIVLLFLVLGAAGWVAHGLFFTELGAKWIVYRVLADQVAPENLVIGKVQGNILNGWTFRDIEAKPRRFPIGSVVLVQGITVSFSSFNYNGLNLKIENARLKMPNSETVVLSGDLKQGIFNVNIFTRSVDVSEVAAFLPLSSKFKKIRGHIDAVDLYVKGTRSTPDITGTFHVDRLTRESVSLVDVPGEVNLRLRQPTARWSAEGEVSLGGGKFEAPHSKVTMLPGKITFPPNNASVALDLAGKARIDQTDIDIKIKGTFKDPDLRLTSDPPLPRNQLLLMLATGKSWGTTETALVDGKLSADVLSDFLDFFIFAGEGKKLVQTFGISDISVHFDSQSQGIGVKKDLTERTGVGYSVDQPRTTTGAASVTQKLEGEYRVTHSLSVDVERNFSRNRLIDETTQSTTPTTDDRILLKFKKSF